MPIFSILIATLVAAIWGYNFVVIHYGLGEFPPLLFGSLRFVFAALPAILFVGRPCTSWRAVLAYGLCLTVEFGLIFVAMNEGFGAGLASVVLQTQAFFTLLLSALWIKDRPTAAQWVGVAVAFLGVVLLSGKPELLGGWYPLTLILLAAAIWGASNILVKQIAPSNGLNFVAWSSAIPPIPLFFLSLWMDGSSKVVQSVTHITATGWYSLAYIGWVSTVCGFALWTNLLRKYSANKVAPFTLLVPFFGITSAHLLLSESFTRDQLIGSSLLILGLVFANLKRIQQPSLLTRPHPLVKGA